MRYKLRFQNNFFPIVDLLPTTNQESKRLNFTRVVKKSGSKTVLTNNSHKISLWNTPLPSRDETSINFLFSTCCYRALLVLAQSSLMKSSTYTSMNDSIHGASAGWFTMGPKSFWSSIETLISGDIFGPLSQKISGTNYVPCSHFLS